MTKKSVTDKSSQISVKSVSTMMGSDTYANIRLIRTASTNCSASNRSVSASSIYGRERFIIDFNDLCHFHEGLSLVS